METLGTILIFIGLFFFFYGPILVIRSLFKKNRGKKFIRKGIALFVGGFIVMGVGTEFLPPEAQVASETEEAEQQSSVNDTVQVSENNEEDSAQEKQEEEEREKEKQKELEEQQKQEEKEKQKEKEEESEKQKEQEEKEREKEKQEQEKQKEKEEEESEKQKEQEEKEEQKQKEEDEQEELAEANPNDSKRSQAPDTPTTVPSGEEYVVVNDNVPYFTNEDITSTETYHENGPLDSLGRVTAANAVVGTEIMPAEERGDISDIKPTGWNQARYAGIGSGGWLYNRSHLIGHQLTGNDAPQNIMTGTRWFNEQMIPFENFVADYVETSENHVRYRVTPVFEGSNLLASGAYMEGFSIEDNGAGLMFNIYIPNRQPNVKIDYSSGSSVGPEGPAEDGEIKEYNSSEATAPAQSTPAPKVEPAPTPEPAPEPEPAPASSGGDLSSVDANRNGTVTISEAEAAGYSMPIRSGHWLYPHMRDSDNDGMVGE